MLLILHAVAAFVLRSVNYSIIPFYGEGRFRQVVIIKAEALDILLAGNLGEVLPDLTETVFKGVELRVVCNVHVTAKLNENPCSAPACREAACNSASDCVAWPLPCADTMRYPWAQLQNPALPQP